jgi:hypothetical protein
MTSVINLYFRKNYKMAPFIYSGSPGKLIHENNLKSKFSCQTPFKGRDGKTHLGRSRIRPLFGSIWNAGDEVMAKEPSHEALDVLSCTSQTYRHKKVLKRCHDSCFGYVFGGRGDLMISPDQVHA